MLLCPLEPVPINIDIIIIKACMPYVHAMGRHGSVDSGCDSRVAVLEYLVATIQAGRMLLAQQDQRSQGDTDMSPASPSGANVSSFCLCLQ